jgi:hypothetical protein
MKRLGYVLAGAFICLIGFLLTGDLFDGISLAVATGLLKEAHNIQRTPDRDFLDFTCLAVGGLAASLILYHHAGIFSA